ncbi:MAG: C25 family cysteine peptidase, partial [candidate division Zixibacteria bacterium]|nr:C25 family cysteine peptidase [candidate division Zixibacteria bacterium]
FCIAIILGISPISTAATMIFNRNLVEIDQSLSEIRYSDNEFTSVGSSVNLSYCSYLIELLPGETVSSISWHVSSPQLLAHLKVGNPFSDKTTSLHNYEALQSPLQAPLGNMPVRIDASSIDGNHRYARIMIFPVTLDSSGSCYFSDSITIAVGGRLISETDLLLPSNLSGDISRGINQNQRQGASGDSPEYIIITDTALQEPCERLTEYKNSTGVITETVMIQDILSTHSGCDDAEKLREFLKEFYSNGGQYVLLAGDETLLPVRYAYYYSTSLEIGLDRLQLCDLYFADLTGDWNADGDNIWGEPYSDEPNIITEIRVGRLPFNSADEMSAYVDKLIVYETNPGDGNPSYLKRAFFFSSDQMRDYSDGGQHGRIARAYPDWFEIDTSLAVEESSGDDPNPYNVPACQLTDDLSEGFGIVNIIAHGCHTAFEVRTSGYNNWPKSHFYSGDPGNEHGNFDSLAHNNRVSLYYSLACNGAAFDKDQPPFNMSGYPICSQLLSLPSAGAVALIGQSRWGWIGSSYHLQKTFYDSLFAHPELPAVDAMNTTKQKYYYYRDLIYGQNFLGDPTLRIYTSVPAKMSLTVKETQSGLQANVSSGELPVDSCLVALSCDGNLIERAQTDINGVAVFSSNLTLGTQYTIASIRVGYTVTKTFHTFSIVTDIDDDENILPASFILNQNYPNPFNPSTSIEFQLPATATVKLSIFNVLGEQVATLAEGKMSAGSHTIIWDATDKFGSKIGSGVYFYRLTANEFTRTRKMLLLR